MVAAAPLAMMAPDPMVSVWVAVWVSVLPELVLALSVSVEVVVRLPALVSAVWKRCQVPLSISWD